MMASQRTLLVVGIVLAILILLHDSDARGSRTSRKSSSTRQSRDTRRTPASSKSETQAKARTFHSSVTRSQIQATKKKPFDRRFVAAAAAGVITYHLVKGPVPPLYSGRYRPYHETSNIVIPKHRALQIEEERYHVEDPDDLRCPNGNLTKYDARNVVNVRSTVSYKKTPNAVGRETIRPQENIDTKQTNLTISAEAINNYVATIEIRITFNQSILTQNATSNTTANATIDLTNCTIMVYESKAYVVESFACRNEASFGFFLFAFVMSIYMS